MRVSQARMFAEAGLPNAERDFVPNSHGALNLAELARDREVHGQVHEALMRAYWAEGRDTGDVDVLVEIGAAHGLDQDEVRDVVTSGRYEERIRDSTRAVLEMGAGGVPAFVVDQRLLIPGAQPHDLFERVMAKIGYGDKVP